MPTTFPTYELRLYADPVALPYGSSTLSRHRSAQAALKAWQYEERQFRASPYGSPNAWLPRVIVEVMPDGREFLLRPCARRVPVIPFPF